MNNRRSFTIAAATLLALSAGCSLDTATTPSVAPADLTQVLAEMSLPGLSGLAGVMPVELSSTPLSPVSGCPYNSTSKSFVCPGVSTQGLRMMQSYSLFDAAGVAQSQFGPTTTARVQANQTMTGTISEPGSAMTIDEQQQLTMSGLLTGRHVLDGTGSEHLFGTESVGTVVDTVDFTSRTTIANLMLPPSATGAKAYPLSGSIAVDMTVKDGSLGVFTFRMEMIFNGTSKVAVTISDSGTSSRCTIDLTSPTPACS